MTVFGPLKRQAGDRAEPPRSFYRAQLGCPLLVGRRVQTSGLIAVDAGMQSKIDRVLSPDQQEKLKDLQRTHESINGESK
jgi:hypothetical protein